MSRTAAGGGRPATTDRRPRAASAAASFASTAAVRARMQAQPTRDTAPELALRRQLHAMGLRYRVDRPPLRGLRRRADVVFGPAKVAVYVDGCFWHACPAHGRIPHANAEWWAAKLAGTRQRDADTDARLAEAGWKVVRIWEHQNPAVAAHTVASVVKNRLSLLRFPGVPEAADR